MVETTGRVEAELLAGGDDGVTLAGTERHAVALRDGDEAVDAADVDRGGLGVRAPVAVRADVLVPVRVLLADRAVVVQALHHDVRTEPGGDLHGSAVRTPVLDEDLGQAALLHAVAGAGELPQLGGVGEADLRPASLLQTLHGDIRESGQDFGLGGAHDRIVHECHLAVRRFGFSS